MTETEGQRLETTIERNLGRYGYYTLRTAPEFEAALAVARRLRGLEVINRLHGHDGRIQRVDRTR